MVSRAGGWRTVEQRRNEHSVGEAKCEEDSSGRPRAEIRLSQKDWQQPVVGNSGAEHGHRW
jgi:hypothetical protein